MAQISKNEVDGALGQLKELDSASSSEPVISPEQIERIKSINNETDPEVKATKTTEQIEALLKEYEQSQQQLESVLQQSGMDTEMVSRFLSGESFDADSQKALSAGQEEFEAAIMGEINAAAQQAGGSEGHGSKRANQAGRMRV